MSDTTRDQFKQVSSELECASGAFSKQAEETMRLAVYPSKPWPPCRN